MTRRNRGCLARALALGAGFTAAVVAVLGADVARADSVSGICPDGSFFVVAKPADAPCARPKFVPASELPPLRPQYLPKPYLWYVDREERDENNPYNLAEKAQQMRALRSAAQGAPDPEGESAGVPTPQLQATQLQATTPAVTPSSVETQPVPAFDPEELRDLVELISVRQSIAPATLVVTDVRGAAELQIKFAYSPAFERRVLETLGTASAGRVLAFAVRSERATEFYPRFFVTQDGESFRPDPDSRAEQGFVLGAPGEMEAGLLTLGYFVVPERFDPTRALTIWWNDRQLEAVLEPKDL